MKTSEIAYVIADKNVKIMVGADCPLVPLVPLTSRRRLDVGWFAFQLIHCLEQNLNARTEGISKLWWNPKMECFAFFLSDFSQHGWEIVVWDGYGEVESWKEVAG